ncbi:MAG: hypothetical protein J5793_02045, partial [Clostridia bacterium]|nr:hypothetical protein [Clostridia bacterium]
MKSRIIRIVAFVLSAAILFAASPFMFSGDTVSGRTIKDIENEIAECKKMLEALKKELSSINTDIKQLENQSSQTEKSLQEYSARIEALETEIEINTQIMESYDFKKADVAAQIAVADANYEYQKEMYKNLIQFIYENSTVNNMELLFTSDNIAQFLSKRDNFDELVNAAEEILRSIKSSLRDLEVLEEELEANQNEYKEYTKQLEISRIELEKAVEDYEEIAASLGLDYEELRDKYKGTNSQIAELNARIKKLTKERDALYESEKGFAWPLESGVSYRISSRFGYRNDPFTGKRKFHSGLDIACARGSGIIASKSGTITT